MMKYIVWLQLCLGAGNQKTVEILEKFGSAEVVFNSDKKSRANSGIFTPSELKRMNTVKLSEAEKIIDVCKKSGIQIIQLGSKKYPFCLSVIENPPLVLYVKGKMPDFDNFPSVAIVGSRKITDYGKRAAFSLSYRIARSGITVVSGGALGCDTYAHAGALKAEGTTVLVMACGILSDYLKENAGLRKAVAESGCLLSEYPPYTDATRYSFPVRNRIISGLTLGTVVIEAGDKSGALITARHAYEQGRDVFVIPHSPHDKNFSGSNALLRDGAKPLLDVSDIFNEYIPRFPDKINIERAFSGKIFPSVNKSKKPQMQKNIKNLNETLSKEAKIVYNHLNKQKFLPEDISDVGLNSQQLISALTELEMEFLIRALPGGMYEKCNF